LRASLSPATSPPSLHDALPISTLHTPHSALHTPHSALRTSHSLLQHIKHLLLRLLQFILHHHHAFLNGRIVCLGTRSVYFPANLDRKSTRLNYSHVKISYAVFC